MNKNRSNTRTLDDKIRIVLEQSTRVHRFKHHIFQRLIVNAWCQISAKLVWYSPVITTQRFKKYYNLLLTCKRYFTQTEFYFSILPKTNLRSKVNIYTNKPLQSQNQCCWKGAQTSYRTISCLIDKINSFIRSRNWRGTQICARITSRIMWNKRHNVNTSNRSVFSVHNTRHAW